MKRRGFSLIELIMVVAIVSLIAASAVLLLRNQLLGNLESDTQIIVDRLQESQARAIAGVNGTAWGIHFDNATTTPYYAIFSGASFTAPSTTYYLSGLVQFSQPKSGSTSDIIFNKLTGTAATTGTIVLKLATSASSTKTISVSTQGQITVQ